MNINIYIEDILANQLQKTIKRCGKSRNTTIREAIKEWSAHYNQKIAQISKYS